ncbi:hypothetical protein ACFX1R_011665 [Malus domestica]
MGHEVHVESSRPFIPILDPTSGAQYHLHPSSSLSLQPMNSFKPQAQSSSRRRRTSTDSKLLRVRVLEKPVLLSAQSPLRR